MSRSNLLPQLMDYFAECCRNYHLLNAGQPQRPEKDYNPAKGLDEQEGVVMGLLSYQLRWQKWHGKHDAHFDAVARVGLMIRNASALDDYDKHELGRILDELTDTYSNNGHIMATINDIRRGQSLLVPAAAQG